MLAFFLGYQPFKGSQPLKGLELEANGEEDIFREEDNYRYFLEKYQKYIVPVADTLAYRLMTNHFLSSGGHQPFKGSQPLKGLELEAAINKFLSLQFSHLFNCYTQAYNKKYNRRGSLLMHFDVHITRSALHLPASRLFRFAHNDGVVGLPG
jgi:hypothetical protein